MIKIGKEPVSAAEIIIISDCHIGRKTQTYNAEVARQRIQRLVEEVRNARRIITRSRVHLDKRILFFLGDIVDGEGVYPRHAYEIEMNIDDQIEFVVKEFQYILSDAHDIVALPGNHGRARIDGTGNWDLMLYYILRERYPNKQFYISRRSKMRYETNGVKWYLTHGDQIRMYQQIPFYGITRDTMREYMLDSFEAVGIAHFHTFYKYIYNGIPIYGNGTMLTDDELTFRMGLKPVNSYWYIVVGERQILFDRELKLVDTEGEADVSNT